MVNTVLQEAMIAKATFSLDSSGLELGAWSEVSS